MAQIKRTQAIQQPAPVVSETSADSVLKIPRKLPDELPPPLDSSSEQKLVATIHLATGSSRLTILYRVFCKEFWNNIGFASAGWDLVATGGLPSLVLKAAATRDQAEALRFIAKTFLPITADCISFGILAHAKDPKFEKSLEKSLE
jgi:hypothetical protein